MLQEASVDGCSLSAASLCCVHHPFPTLTRQLLILLVTLFPSFQLLWSFSCELHLGVSNLPSPPPLGSFDRRKMVSF